MHCRPFYRNNDSTCLSSFIFDHSKYINTLDARTCSTSSYHDQIPPVPAPRRRRRLDDPVVTNASNYYVTYPREASHSPLELPPVPSHRQIYPQSEQNNIYCDLFNLLECPPPIKQRKIFLSNEYSPHRRHRSVDYARAHAKMKDSNQRKRHYQQPSYYEENKHHQLDKLSSIQQYDQIQNKAKNPNTIYPRHLPSQGFFRRIARHYFCMPMTLNGDEFSN